MDATHARRSGRALIFGAALGCVTAKVTSNIWRPHITAVNRQAIRRCSHISAGAEVGWGWVSGWMERYFDGVAYSSLEGQTEARIEGAAADSS